MIGKNIKLYSLILMITDAVMVMVAFILAYVIRVQYDPRPLLANVYAADYFQTFLLVVPFWIIVFASLGLYQATTYNRRLIEWFKVFIGSFIGILFVIGFQFVSDKDILPARLVAVYGFIGAFLLTIIGRELMRSLKKQMFSYGIGISRVLIIGHSKITADVAFNISKTSKSGFEVVAIAGPGKIMPKSMDFIHYSNFELALKNIKTDEITAIIQTDLFEDEEKNQLILNTAQSNHIRYSFIPGEPEFYSGKNIVDIFLGYPMISVYQTPLIGWGAIAKRLFDIIISTILIIILSPIFLIVIILQKILNPGTVFYVHKRLSKFSKPFYLIKFRSMKHLVKGYEYKDAAEEFRAVGREDLAIEYEKNRKVENDPRITKFGKFLRKTSIDELPQLFNVLKGDLSLVGPRPIMPQERKLIKGRKTMLHSVQSGVTGLWQVSGRNDLSFDERIELENFYAQNWSFWLDIKILFKTIAVVFFKKGAK